MIIIRFLNPILIIYIIHIFLFTDWLKVSHMIKNVLTILQKLHQSHKSLFQAVNSLFKCVNDLPHEWYVVYVARVIHC